MAAAVAEAPPEEPAAAPAAGYGAAAAAAAPAVPQPPSVAADTHSLDCYAVQLFSSLNRRGGACELARGDKCFVWLRSDKRSGRAVVLQTPDSLAPDSAWPGRFHVEFQPSGLTAHVRPERLLPVFTQQQPFQQPLLLVCYSTDDYRRMARSQVTQDDVVLELGCSYGLCTAMLAEHAGCVVGVDIAEPVVQEARRRFPHLRFELADVLEEPAALLKLMSSSSSNNSSSAGGGGGCCREPAASCDARAGCTDNSSARKPASNGSSSGGSAGGGAGNSSSSMQFSALFVDIGGNRQLEALLRLLPWCAQQLRPRLIVVKSEELAEAAVAQLQRQQQEQAQPQQDQLQLEREPQQSREQDQQHVQLPERQQQQQQQQQPQQAQQPQQEQQQQSRPQQQQQPQQRQLPRSKAAPAAAVTSGRIASLAAWWQALEASCNLNTVRHARAEPWFLAVRAAGFTKNPLRLPLRFTADGTRICRPHNYARCFKIETCPWDHETCHHCLQSGHRARDCTLTV